jgi:hypothetical protein
MQQVQDGNLARVFLAEPVIHAPGTHFLYNTGASYMLSAIVQKVTRENIHDFLKPRLFEPLNIQNSDWEMDPNGICVGGYGLRIRTEDIARFGQLYLQNGEWNGTQLLPSSWVEEATKKQTESQEGNGDWSQGYGYQFWRCRPEPGFYRGDGAFGQYCIVIPQKNTVIAVTSESRDMQASMDLIWEHILPALGETPSLPPNDDASNELKEKLKTLSLPVLSGNISSPIATEVTRKRYTLAQNSDGAKSIFFELDQNKSSIGIEYPEAIKSIQCGLGRWITNDHEFPLQGSLFVLPKQNVLKSKIAACAVWKSENTLLIKIKFIEGMHSDLWTCIFENDKISISFLNSINILQNKDDHRSDWNGKLE